MEVTPLTNRAFRPARGLIGGLTVLLAGVLTMIGIAWVLDRADNVPDLFVDVAEIEGAKAALEPGKA